MAQLSHCAISPIHDTFILNLVNLQAWQRRLIALRVDTKTIQCFSFYSLIKKAHVLVVYHQFPFIAFFLY